MVRTLEPLSMICWLLRFPLSSIKAIFPKIILSEINWTRYCWNTLVFHFIQCATTKTIWALTSYFSRQIAKKAVCRSVFLTDSMALYFKCRINKKAFLQTDFLAILPTGYAQRMNENNFRWNFLSYACLIIKNKLSESVFYSLNCSIPCTHYEFEGRNEIFFM